ncbi:MAG: sigma-54-dependent transcriptional regulator [Planctomycetota bacterium]
MKVTLLLVDDDEGLRTTLARSFSRRGLEVIQAPNVGEARRVVEEKRLDLVLLDIQLPDGSGLEVLEAIREQDKETLVIVLTAYPDIKVAVDAIKAGARDFLLKPFELEELNLVIERALEGRELRRKVRRLEREKRRREDPSEILGNSPAIQDLREQIRKVAQAATPVLIQGETGTGKELIADSIHRLSPRSASPLIKVNCSAFSEQLLESELFGHEKGAFTGAQDARSGLFEMAEGGSLFLDEVSELKPSLQAKLLRIVEGHPFRRLGGKREIRTDVRVIAATNRDLEKMVQAQGFREDLFFRLNVFPIEAPPLRVRTGDPVLLAGHFLDRSAGMLRKPGLQLTHEAKKALESYPWPGNVREVRNVMERAAILAEGGIVGLEHLPGGMQVSAFLGRRFPSAAGGFPPLAEVEKLYIERVLEQAGGNLSEASRVLGISRNTLKARLRG